MAKLTMRMTKTRVALPVMLAIANTMLERINFTQNKRTAADEKQS